MFWETLWPLILGFGLSGAVQAFVSRESMQQKLGDHRPGSVARASGYGMVSSSCSYAASAMAKSLFVKGADFVAAMVFMFASTNLVHRARHRAGRADGMAVRGQRVRRWHHHDRPARHGGALWLRGRRSTRPGTGSASGRPRHEHRARSGRKAPPPAAPLSERLRSKAGWADSATYTMSDLTMLRRELVIGYVVAGFLAVLVPDLGLAGRVHQRPWLLDQRRERRRRPLHRHHQLRVLHRQRAPGRRPVAGRISFGGVIAFIFADLITFPLLMIYRRYYGTRLMLRMLAVFWALMSTAGLITEGSSGRPASCRPSARPALRRPISRGTTRPTSTSSSWRSSASST